jgi:N-acetylglucosaminyl-diphospho-decaprenol L-rhamnosyltransferase
MISTIIVTHNSLDVIPQCLDSIDGEIIVVDNGSTDGTQEYLKQRDVILIENENTGFGDGCNIGAKRATGEYLFFLNPDARVINIEPLLSAFTDDVAMTVPKVNEGGNVWRRVSILRPLLDLFPFKPGRYVENCSGCAMMVRRDVFNELGGFDPSYFMYAEDVDLCWRISKKYKIAYVPEAQVNHLGGTSTPWSAIETRLKEEEAFLKFLDKLPRYQSFGINAIKLLVAYSLKFRSVITMKDTSSLDKFIFIWRSGLKRSTKQ